MLLADLIIAATHGGVLVVRDSPVEADLAAGILRVRQSLREIQGRGREQRFIDTVDGVAIGIIAETLDRRSQHALHTVVAGLRRECRAP